MLGASEATGVKGGAVVSAVDGSMKANGTIGRALKTRILIRIWVFYGGTRDDLSE